MRKGGAQAHLKGTGGSLKKFVGWIVEVVQASSRSRQKVCSPTGLAVVRDGSPVSISRSPITSPAHAEGGDDGGGTGLDVRRR